MNIGMGLIVFLISLIALVAEFILYFIFGFGASFSGNISTLEGVVFFFVGLMVLTGAIGFLYPFFAIIATVTKRKSLCIRLFIIILGIIFIGYFFIFPTSIKKVKSTTVLKQDKLEKIVTTQKNGKQRFAVSAGEIYSKANHSVELTAIPLRSILVREFCCYLTIIKVGLLQHWSKINPKQK